jgi:hypothetical protein
VVSFFGADISPPRRRSVFDVEEMHGLEFPYMAVQVKDSPPEVERFQMGAVIFERCLASGSCGGWLDENVHGVGA